jgi:hypothetical protein
MNLVGDEVMSLTILSTNEDQRLVTSSPTSCVQGPTRRRMRILGARFARLCQPRILDKQSFLC